MSKEKVKRASVYRFGDMVAITFTGTTATLYLSRAMADSVANALLDNCRDIDENAFTESVLKEYTLTEKGN